MTILHLFFHYLFFINHLEIALSSILLKVCIKMLLLWFNQVAAYLLWEDNLPSRMLSIHLTDFIVSIILGLDHFTKKYILKIDYLYNLQDLLWTHSKPINVFIFFVIWYFLLRPLFFLLWLQLGNYLKLQLLELRLIIHYAVLLIVIEYFP